MLNIHYDPVMLYARFKDRLVAFIARYVDTIGDSTKGGTSYTFRIHSRDEAILNKFKTDGFVVTLDEPVNTFIESGTVRIDATADQIELLNSIYKAIREHYDSLVSA